MAISNFNSEEIQITAKESIDIDKCYGEKIVLETENGDIISKNLLQAANITAKSKKGVRFFLFFMVMNFQCL